MWSVDTYTSASFCTLSRLFQIKAAVPKRAIRLKLAFVGAGREPVETDGPSESEPEPKHSSTERFSRTFSVGPLGVFPVSGLRVHAVCAS